MLSFPSPPHPSSSPIYTIRSPYESLLGTSTHSPYNPLAEPLSPAASLPHGVVARILKLSIQGLSTSSRYLALRSAALVCRSWRNPALELLGRDVVIHSQGKATRWLDSPTSLLYPTERLEIDGRFGQVNDVAAEVVIGHTRGCRRLRVDFVRGLSSGVFSSPNLAGLTHLTLHCKVWTDAAPIDLPFRLTHLVLGGSYFPLRFIDALFESLHETLVDLVLTLRTQQSPTLRRLIADRVATCTHLITLSDSTRGSQDLLDLLLPELLLSLEVLNVSFGDKNRIHELARRFSLANLPRLRYLRFMYLSLNNIRGSAEGNQMLRYCRISGVQVLFGFELDYLREEHLLAGIDALKIYY